MSRRGFALPSVVFAVAIMSIIVVAALSASSDERRASRAVRESTLAGTRRKRAFVRPTERGPVSR